MFLQWHASLAYGAKADVGKTRKRAAIKALQERTKPDGSPWYRPTTIIRSAEVLRNALNAEAWRSAGSA